MKTILRSCLLGIVTLVSVHLSFAQNRIITGKVTSAKDGGTIPGVNVIIKSTSNGTTTNMDGNYTLSSPENATLVFTYIGYADYEISVGDQTVINISMEEDVTKLGEVVITALGISREKRSLNYAASELDASELTGSKDASFINALSGKVSGVQINKSASGIGGSTRVILRGNSSTRDNNVLYVIDGVPMLNYSTSQASSVWGGSTNGSGSAGRDGGDAISNLNPEDIESMSVLKGASASALYGSQAANGVILITTKSGKSGEMKVHFSSNYSTETVLVEPGLQYKYGQTSAGALNSWGSAKSSTDHVSDFFNTGSTFINSISLSGGKDVSQSYFSYANTNSKGIVPTSEFNKHNLNFKENANFFNDKLALSSSINLVTQKAHNRPSSGLYFNTLTGLYSFPRGLDFETYKNDFEVFNTNRLLHAQNWISDDHTQQNPYWILHRNQNDDSRTRFIANAEANYTFNEHLNVRVKGTSDHTYDYYEQRSYASTQTTLADANGRYILQKTNSTQQYGEAVLMYDNVWNDISFNGILGTSINDIRIKSEFADSKDADLQYANVFSIQNISQPGATFKQVADRSQLQAVFASLGVGFKGMIYVDITGRRDWSSTLAFTDDVSFFYPSFGATVLVNEMIRLPKSINLLKLRGSLAKVGNGLNAFDTHILNPITNKGVQTPNAAVPAGETLKPESQSSFEIGADVSMLQGKFGFDFTYYNNATSDQRILIDAPPGSGADKHIVNAGEIKNKGIEIGINGNPIANKDFNWDVYVTYTQNTNTVVSLSESLEDGIFYLSEAGVNNYAMAIREGGSFGELYGKKFQREGDNIVVDEAGKPQAAPGALELVGDINPDFLIGFKNTFTYKKFTLNFLIDGRFGGEVMSITESMNDELGVSKTTADARDAGGVAIGAVSSDGSPVTGLLDAKTFYETVGGRAGITEHYIYSATNIRLREFSLGYTLPMADVDFIKNIKISLVGRNLFFIRNDAPFDPDVSMSTGTALQGVDAYTQPATRSLGFNLSVAF